MLLTGKLATADSLGGILGFLSLCGVLILIVLFCIQKRPIQRVQQRRERCEINFKKGTRRTGNPCSDINASSSLRNHQPSIDNVDHNHLCSEIEALATIKSTAHNGKDSDDNDYDDIINVANLSKVSLEKERERFDTTEILVDHESEYGDYDDVIIISTVASQRQLESLTTYNANPAYTTRQEYLAAGVEPLPELMNNNDSPSDLDDYENADEVDLMEELIDNDAYIKTDLDYLQLVPAITSTSNPQHHVTTSSTQKSATGMSPSGSPQESTAGVSSCVTVTSSDVHHLLMVRLINEVQVSTVGQEIQTGGGVVLHEYDKLQGHVPVVVSHEGQSSPRGDPTLGIDTKDTSNTSGGEDEPLNASIQSTPHVHVYDSIDSMEKGDDDQAGGNAKKTSVVGDFDASATDTAIDTDQSADDPDYTFDRLCPYVHMDPEQLLHSESSLDSNNTHRFAAGDVTYSRISPVTHWQKKWTNEDLMKANAVYAKVNTLSKKPKPGTLDKELGTLV